MIGPKVKHEPSQHLHLDHTPMLIQCRCISRAKRIIGERFDEVAESLLVASADTLEKLVDLVANEEGVRKLHPRLSRSALTSSRLTQFAGSRSSRRRVSS